MPPTLPDTIDIDDPWIGAIWREFRVGHLSLLNLRVLIALHDFRDDEGIARPTHARMGYRVGCEAGAVQRTLDRARALGLISWVKRHQGFYRASNAYRFRQPAGPSL